MIAGLDSFKAAEKLGYAKGYRAGRVRRQRAIERDQLEAKREAFIERAFLALLPSLLENKAGWGNRDAAGKHTSFSTAPERIDFAWKKAIEAWDHRRFY